jgi:glutamate-ammonia-ligase adenylyltransferase
MREQSDKSRPGHFDLKQGVGGIADIEFMVQYLTLRWASEHPDLVRWTDNIRLLETLARHDLLPGASATALADAYRALRAAYHRCVLLDAPTLIGDDVLVAERTQVRALWERLLED